MQSRLGEYMLIERLNQGGMADVYLAKRFGLGGTDQILAVKCIRADVAEDPDFIRMFINEAKLSVMLDHANIAKTYELGCIDKTYFMAMAYVCGRDLRALIDRSVAKAIEIPVHVALKIVIEVCEGLDYAHRKADPTGVPLHIVHRDVSPQNVLVSYTGNVKLIDFGIAKAATHASRSRAGVLKGKYGYMSPEQVRGLPVDHRSDVFAAGVLLWELLTGERLFPGSTDFSVLEKVRHAEIYPPTSINPKLDSDLEQVVFRALERKPDRRFGSASDLGDALVEVMLKKYAQPTRGELEHLMLSLFVDERDEDMRRLEEARAYSSMPADLPSLTEDDPDRAPAEEQRPTTQLSPPLNHATVIDESPSDVVMTAAQASAPVAQPVSPPAIGEARPTEVREAFKRKRRGLRDLLIVAAALAVASGLVSFTWLSTRTPKKAERGGVIVFTAPRDAEVLLDGVLVGNTPFSSSSVAVGKRRLSIKKRSYATIKRDIQIEAGRVVELRFTLRAERRR